MKYSEANKQFNALECFDKTKQNVLLTEGVVFCTRAKFNEFEAVKFMGEAPEGAPYNTNETTYGGTLITSKANDWDEARKIAELRGFGEIVDGILQDVIPWDDAGRNSLNMN